jgi:hypothetical protein
MTTIMVAPKMSMRYSEKARMYSGSRMSRKRRA